MNEDQQFDRRRLLPYLRLWRKARLMSQRDLAAVSGVGAGHISMIERQQSGGSFSTIQRLAKALDTTPTQLAYERPPMFEEQVHEAS